MLQERIHKVNDLWSVGKAEEILKQKRTSPGSSLHNAGPIGIFGLRERSSFFESPRYLTKQGLIMWKVSFLGKRYISSALLSFSARSFLGASFPTRVYLGQNLRYHCGPLHVVAFLKASTLDVEGYSRGLDPLKGT